MACVFQALRIEVNDEMQALEEMLAATLRCSKVVSLLAVITYHSLEDRMVKNFFRAGVSTDQLQELVYGRSGSVWEPITRKPIVPSAEELQTNPRSRSAALRVGAKK